MVNIIVGDETGLLKLINSDTGDVKTYGQQSRSNQIVKIVAGDSSATHFGVIRINGDVEEWAYDENLTDLELCSTVTSQIENPVTAASVDNGILVVNQSGESSFIRTNVDQRHDFSLNGPISTCCSSSLMKNSVALGGKERDLYVFDVHNKQIAWEAKNVPHDNLNLRVPVWITAIDILDENTIVTGTAHKHIRLYDLRTSQRPIKSFDLDSDFRVASLKVTHDSRLVVGDTGGNQFFYDVPSFRPVRTFKGATGSIRSIDIHNDYLVTGGLDRHVRVYRQNSGTAIHSVYTKNRITSLLCIGKDDNSSCDQSEGSDDLVESIDDEDEDNE